jgi:hypothetical protein
MIISRIQSKTEKLSSDFIVDMSYYALCVLFPTGQLRHLIYVHLTVLVFSWHDSKWYTFCSFPLDCKLIQVKFVFIAPWMGSELGIFHMFSLLFSISLLIIHVTNTLKQRRMWWGFSFCTFDFKWNRFGS